MSPSLRRLAIRRVVVVVKHLERIAGLQVALEIHLVREHVNHLDDDVGRNAGLHRGEIETGIDGRAGAVITRLQCLLHVLRGEGAVGAAS